METAGGAPDPFGRGLAGDGGAAVAGGAAISGEPGLCGGVLAAGFCGGGRIAESAPVAGFAAGSGDAARGVCRRRGGAAGVGQG